MQLILRNSERLLLTGFRNTLTCHQLGNSITTFYLTFPPFPGHRVLPISMISVTNPVLDKTNSPNY